MNLWTKRFPLNFFKSPGTTLAEVCAVRCFYVSLSTHRKTIW